MSVMSNIVTLNTKFRLLDEVPGTGSIISTVKLPIPVNEAKYETVILSSTFRKSYWRYKTQKQAEEGHKQIKQILSGVNKGAI